MPAMSQRKEKGWACHWIMPCLSCLDWEEADLETKDVVEALFDPAPKD